MSPHLTVSAAPRGVTAPPGQLRPSVYRNFSPMSYDSDFDDMLVQTVVISTRTTFNNYGEASYASGSTYRARIVAKPGFVRSAMGESVAIKSVVWVASTGTITVDDRLTL